MNNDDLKSIATDYSMSAKKSGVVGVKCPTGGKCSVQYLRIPFIVALIAVLVFIFEIGIMECNPESSNVPPFQLICSMKDVPKSQFAESNALKIEKHYAVQMDSTNIQLQSDPLCSRSCSNPRYERHPLLVISLDGFAHEYLGRKIVKTLDRFKKCGAMAKWMYASYPSKTFPNHYTMVTGLYPEAHGIVDNEVHDFDLSDDLVDTRKTTDRRFFKGEPIWVTAAKHNLTTACLFWAGCAVDFNGIRPAFNPPYDPTMNLTTQINMLVNWLLLPQTLRPSLLLAYVSQPDYAGHFQRTDEEVSSSLKDLNVALEFLLDSLHKYDLLGCLNMIILSDHGMQKLDKRFYLDEMLNTQGMIVSSSVTARIELADSTLTKSEVLNHFRCKNNGTIFRIYDKQHRPTRYHYDMSDRIGDFLIEGQPGSAFYATRSHDIGVAADHGYDYIVSSMRTIFYAVGPSVLPMKYIEPIQNVEIYNLIADFIGIHDRAPNNGTYGRMHEILVDPPKTNVTAVASNMINCLSIREFENAFDSELTFCSNGVLKGHFGYTDVKSSYCYVSLCSATAFFLRPHEIGHTPIVYEVITRSKLEKGLDDVHLMEANCTSLYNRMHTNCDSQISRKNGKNAENQISISLVLNPKSKYKGLQELQVLVYEDFQRGPLETLQSLIKSYVEKFERIVVISGAVNIDYSERTKSVSVQSYAPTHIFVVLLRCAYGDWSNNGHFCKEASQTRVLSFILPNLPDDLNCLDPLEYLRVNTARVRDVELLTGLEFFFSRLHYPQNIALQLRTYIPDEIWSFA